jgi:hypothetical protein
MHIGQGFMSLKGAINIAVLSNAADPIKISRKSSLGLADIIFGSRSFKLTLEHLFVKKQKPMMGGIL